MLGSLKSAQPSSAFVTSIRHLKASSAEPERHRVARLQRRLDETGVAHLDNPSHIVPVKVCDPVLCKQISDVLIDRYGIYVQPINYPTVPRGTERLRITPVAASYRYRHRAPRAGAGGDLGGGRIGQSGLTEAARQRLQRLPRVDGRV